VAILKFAKAFKKWIFTSDMNVVEVTNKKKFS